MNVIKYPDKKNITELLKRPVKGFEEISKIVKPILESVKELGDEALKKFTREFDKVELDSLVVSREEINDAAGKVDEKLKKAIEHAKDNIQKFHEAQRWDEGVIKIDDGIECWRKSVAIKKVGLYIPGGTSPLFSTVLMLGIPARLAGCPEIILCTPVGRNGNVHPAILYTASLIGIDKIYKVG